MNSILTSILVCQLKSGQLGQARMTTDAHCPCARNFRGYHFGCKAILLQWDARPIQRYGNTFDVDQYYIFCPLLHKKPQKVGKQTILDLRIDQTRAQNGIRSICCKKHYRFHIEIMLGMCFSLSEEFGHFRSSSNTP